MKSLHRFAVPMAFVFAVGLTAPSAGFAAPERGGLHWPDWLGFLSHLWAPQGCGLEPVGGCGNASTPTPRDEGCMLEPVGRCTNASAPAPRDHGCMVDPVGRCID
jgi:hypothetical protein